MTELIRKLLGWCPMKEPVTKEEEFMFSNENRASMFLRSNSRIFLGGVHLVFALYLISTALSVLSQPNTRMFPWWIMDINFVASWILLTIGIISLVLSFSSVKRDGSYDNACKVLALANIVLAIVFFAYLHQSIARIWYSGTMAFLKGPLFNYTFDLPTLLLYSALVALPAILSLLMLFRGTRESHSPEAGKRSYLALAITVILVAATSVGLGIYYNHLNQQKTSMLVEEFGVNQEIKLYSLNDDFIRGTWMQGQGSPYFIDSKESTSGRFISEDTYSAMRFLKEVDAAVVMAWWDPTLMIEAGGKTPVIRYASESIKHTVARPTSFIDVFEPDERVADVARFFTTDSAEEAEGIAKKYDATIVYMPRHYGSGLFWAITEAQDVEIEHSSDSEWNRLYEESMYHKFEIGSEMGHFEKIFENDDVCIYRLG
jgi:hypothetical protein